MEMKYTSFRAEVLKAMELHKKEFCEAIGTLAVSEVQRQPKEIMPVLTGNLRRSITYEVMPNNEGVYIGVTAAAPYALTIEKGLSGHKAKPFLETGTMNAIPKITDVAIRVYKQMGE